MAWSDEIVTNAPDDGVLGNLPRSRPGTRSAKRDRPKQQRGKRSAPPPPRAAAARAEPVASVPRAEPRVLPPPPAASQPQPDLVDLSLRAAEAWAGIVLFWPRVAIHVTHAVIRRLPRLF